MPLGEDDAEVCGVPGEEHLAVLCVSCAGLFPVRESDVGCFFLRSCCTCPCPCRRGGLRRGEDPWPCAGSDPWWREIL